MALPRKDSLPFIKTSSENVPVSSDLENPISFMLCSIKVILAVRQRKTERMEEADLIIAPTKNAAGGKENKSSLLSESSLSRFFFTYKVFFLFIAI